MADILKVQTFLLLLLWILSLSLSLPTPDSDLIDGNEFLSLFIEQSKTRKNLRYDRTQSSSSPSSNNFDEDDLKESIISVESILANDEEILMQDSSNYGLRLHNRSRNQKYIPKLQKHKPSATHSAKDNHDYLDADDSSEDGLNNGKPKKHIIKMVTSGSKIIFLEEVTPKENLSQNFTSPINTKLQNGERNSNSTSPKDVQVLSVRVSSTVGKSYNSPVKSHQLAHLQPLENIENNNDPLEDDKSDFINRSHKSEFSIEEAEPVTQESVADAIIAPATATAAAAADSANGESTNLHRIVAPPNPINQSKQKNMTTINSSAQIQRRQDKLLPFQTVIYHDSGFNKDGNAQPRSVSYSSIAQSVDEINSWKELDSLVQVRQSVNESLHNPKFPERVNAFGQSPEKVYSEPARVYSEPAKVYGEPSKVYSEPAKIYSEPAKVYGEPEKQYGEPAKVYSEPSKVYSEPSKVYSEPSKIYSEPSRVYWPRTSSTTTPTPPTSVTTKNSNSRRIIFNLDKLPYDLLNAPQPSKQLLELDSSTNHHAPGLKNSIGVTLTGTNNPQSFGQQTYNQHHFNPTTRTPTHSSRHHQNFPNHRNLVTDKPNISITSAITESSENIYTPTPEQNYEIEESVSVMTSGRTHGIRPTQKGISTPNPSQDDPKVGYVVEGRNYRKYRVEEKTSDGFIVGEYGVVSHNDGSLRGVRYTADSTINPSLIHEALMKFLSL